MTLSPIYPLHRLLGNAKSSQSSFVVSWQRIYNSLIVTTTHIKSSFRRLTPLYSFVFLRFSFSLTDCSLKIPSYIALRRTPRKTLSWMRVHWPVTQQWISFILACFCTHYPAMGCLPRICLHENVFIEQLPSSGSIRHVTLPWTIGRIGELSVSLHFCRKCWNHTVNKWTCIQFEVWHSLGAPGEALVIKSFCLIYSWKLSCFVQIYHWQIMSIW
jgi:hypothetical protein